MRITLKSAYADMDANRQRYPSFELPNFIEQKSDQLHMMVDKVIEESNM
jgi:hypothetical protein